jgi:hypothetical protein
VSQDLPQHGLFVASGAIAGGALAAACASDPPFCVDSAIGPPQLTSVILVNPELSEQPAFPNLILVHELGHAVGMPHHGSRVTNWEMEVVRTAIVPSMRGREVGLAPGNICQDPSQGGPHDEVLPLYREGTFVGCYTPSIIQQGGITSGNVECIMRYMNNAAWYHDAPGGEAHFAAAVSFDEAVFPDRREHFPARTVELYAGTFAKNKGEGESGTASFCRRRDGTGLNALPGDDNHAGATVVACMDQLVVNDTVLRGIR